MNTLIVFVSVLAVALASHGYAGLGAYSGQYAGPYAAQAYGGHYGAQAYGGHYGGHYTGPLASGLTVAPVGRLVDPAAIAAGAPLPTGDTVEVAHAKAAHYQAYATEAARNGAVSYAAHATPLAYAHATPLAYNNGGHYGAQAYGGHYGGHYTGPLASGLTVAPVGRLVDPAAIAAGAPLPTGDTVEVAHAKAAHFQAYATEASRNGAVSYAAHGSPLAYNSGFAHASPLAYAHATPLAYNSGYAHASPIAYAHASPAAYAHGAYSAPLHVGDTHEVAHAKAAHFQAHAIARAGLKHY